LGLAPTDGSSSISPMRIYTKKGDTGTTGLLFGGARISKADLRTDAYGTTDEAVSALGLARAAIGAVTDRTEAELSRLIVRLQRELFVVGGELATHVEKRQKLTDGVTRVTAEMVTWLEGEIDAIEAGHEMPAEFVLPGESMTGAALDMARSIVRRAERRAVQLADEGGLPDSQVVPYLNRLADLLFVMARAADGGFRPLRSRE
jgi:cob(I)alamin adenosyltransferase